MDRRVEEKELFLMWTSVLVCATTPICPHHWQPSLTFASIMMNQLEAQPTGSHNPLRRDVERIHEA
jgi:hypothetical protein